MLVSDHGWENCEKGVGGRAQRAADGGCLDRAARTRLPVLSTVATISFYYVIYELYVYRTTVGDLPRRSFS